MRDVWGIHDFTPDWQALTPRQHAMVQRGAGPGDGIPGGPSGCGYYRITQPLDALAGMGWDVGYGAGEPPCNPAAAREARVIIAQRMDKHSALPYWRRWRAWQPLIYEIDDNVFEVDVTNWQAYRTYSKGDIQDAVSQAASVADIVTVTTGPLADVMSQFNPEVRVVPNTVDERVLAIDRCRQPKVVVGWMGGASHARDIALIAPTLRTMLDRHGKKAELHIVGTDFRPTVGRDARYTDWVPVRANLDFYRTIDFDIGLAPLTGTRFDQSKSAIKAIEYNALGIPVLASDCEPYRDFIQDGVNGYLCRSKQDWGRRLEELISDKAAREQLGAAGRELVRANHTMVTGVKAWAAVLGEVM